MSLRISTEVMNSMKQHAEEEYPHECCGFLFGREQHERHITHSNRAVNQSEGDHRRRFRIDPFEYREAEQFAVENGLELLGIYHSHPDHPARPSEHDLSVAMPFFSYIILSVERGQTVDVRSWILNEERKFEEEKIEKHSFIKLDSKNS